MSKSQKEKFIKSIINSNNTISETVILLREYEGLEQDGIIGIKVKDFLYYQNELILDYPNKKYYEYCKELIENGKNRVVRFYFSSDYEFNLELTFKQLVSYYIKNYK